MFRGLESITFRDIGVDNDLLTRCAQLGISDVTTQSVTEETAIKYCLEYSSTSQKTGVRSLHLDRMHFPSTFFRKIVEVTFTHIFIVV